MGKARAESSGRDRDGIDRAVEVFVRGFSYTHSFTHPYTPERVGRVWVVRDAPRRSGAYRAEEWFAHEVEPAEVDRVARTHTRGRFAICAVLRDDGPGGEMRAAYKALGYRLRRTEPIMVHPLRRIPRCDVTAAAVERVTTPELATRLAKVAGSRQILPEHLAARARDDAPLRQYVATAGGELVGWVRSIRVRGDVDAAWCSNMYVLPAHRRRGIARAMLCRMLRDDRAAGASVAVLSASHVGARLYPLVGYEPVATLYLYSPAKR